MAEEESRNKSRSMETSLRMRLDHGLPLTPKLLGFQHNEEGKLIINPDVRRLLSGEVPYQLDYHSKWRFQSDLNG